MKRIQSKLIAALLSLSHAAPVFAQAFLDVYVETSDPAVLADTQCRMDQVTEWKRVSDLLNDDGFLGYVQGIGAEPATVHSDQYRAYGNGAFLLAAGELARMTPLNVPEIPPLSSAGVRPKRK